MERDYMLVDEIEENFRKLNRELDNAEDLLDRYKRDRINEYALDELVEFKRFVGRIIFKIEDSIEYLGRSHELKSKNVFKRVYDEFKEFFYQKYNNGSFSFDVRDIDELRNIANDLKKKLRDIKNELVEVKENDRKKEGFEREDGSGGDKKYNSTPKIDRATVIEEVRKKLTELYKLRRMSAYFEVYQKNSGSEKYINHITSQIKSNEEHDLARGKVAEILGSENGNKKLTVFSIWADLEIDFLKRMILEMKPKVVDNSNYPEKDRDSIKQYYDELEQEIGDKKVSSMEEFSVEKDLKFWTDATDSLSNYYKKGKAETGFKKPSNFSDLVMKGLNPMALKCEETLVGISRLSVEFGSEIDGLATELKLKLLKIKQFYSKITNYGFGIVFKDEDMIEFLKEVEDIPNILSQIKDKKKEFDNIQKQDEPVQSDKGVETNVENNLKDDEPIQSDKDVELNAENDLKDDEPVQSEPLTDSDNAINENLSEEKEKTLRQKFNTSKEEEFEKLLKYYAEYNARYYNTKKKSPEEIRKRKNINAQFKRIIQKKTEIIKNQESLEGSNFSQKMEQINSGELFSKSELEDVVKNKGAVLKLFEIMSSGIYEKNGERIRLSQKQRIALAATLQRVSELTLSKNNDKLKTESESGSEMSGSHPEME